MKSPINREAREAREGNAIKLTILILAAVACAHSKDNAPPPAPVAQVSQQAAAGVPADAGVPDQKPATGTVPAVEVAAPTPMPDEAFRDQLPKPLSVQPHFEAPQPIVKKLKSGVKVLIVENHSVPLVAIDVRFLHGIDTVPPAKAGLASFVADTVDEGTEKRTATKLAEEIEDLSLAIGASASIESSNVHLNSLSETLPQALDLLSDMIQHPAFRTEDVERVRTLRLSGLQQKKASIGALAADEAARLFYGADHPWGQPSGGTPETVAAITPDDLRAWHKTWWVPNDAVISVSGDVTPAKIVALLEEKFAGWKPRPLPKLKLPPLPKLGPRAIDALEKPNATQSQVWVLGRMFPAKDLKDAIPMRVANLTLGGLFTSRLNMNLREAHGYSYGVGSSLALLRGTGTIVAAGGIIAKNTVDAIGEYEKELAKFSDGTVTQTELDASREALIRGLPSGLETNDAVAGAMANLVSLGLPLDYYATFPSRVSAVTLEDVKRVVTKYVKPDEWPILVVGPVGALKEPLEKLNLGTVRLAQAAAAK